MNSKTRFFPEAKDNSPIGSEVIDTAVVLELLVSSSHELGLAEHSGPILYLVSVPRECWNRVEEFDGCQIIVYGSLDDDERLAILWNNGPCARTIPAMITDSVTIPRTIRLLPNSDNVASLGLVTASRNSFQGVGWYFHLYEWLP